MKIPSKSTLISLTLFVASAIVILTWDFRPGVALKLDQEEQGFGNQPINPSTQSVNRYSSVLRKLDRLTEITLSEDDRFLSFEIGSEKTQDRLFAKNIHASYLVPLLPYPHEGRLDAFDNANLMLGEYARSGVELSYQQSNALFGLFHDSNGLFDGDQEYRYENGMIMPNPRVRPIRFAVINNCLKPSLWEFSAKDSVGEMYHSWFDFPKSLYLNLIRKTNRIQETDGDLADALDYRKDLSDAPLRLERLRVGNQLLESGTPELVTDKKIGAYSSQDSRRKVQQGYFQILRDRAPILPATFVDLRGGDVFRVKKFVSPGVYSAFRSEYIPFNPEWSRFEIREVTPLTRYPDSQQSFEAAGYVEIFLYEHGEEKAIVVGNIPVSLLVAQEDFHIPAFGVGVLPPSEPVERRYLRFREGPAPQYAYQIQKKPEADDWALVNNHESGIEQVFIRPFTEHDRLFLRVTLVSYERIVDLLELKLEIKGELRDRIRNATESYKPPLFRVYEDSNII